MRLNRLASNADQSRSAPKLSLMALAALMVMVSGKIAALTGCAKANKPDIAVISSESPPGTPPQNPNKFPGTVDSTKLNTIFASVVRRTDVVGTLYEFRAELIGGEFDPNNPTKKGSLPGPTDAPYPVVFRYEEPAGTPREVSTDISTRTGGNKIAFVPRTITNPNVQVIFEVRRAGQTVVPPTLLTVADQSDRKGHSLGTDG